MLYAWIYASHRYTDVYQEQAFSAQYPRLFSGVQRLRRPPPPPPPKRFLAGELGAAGAGAGSPKIPGNEATPVAWGRRALDWSRVG
jgi:hypothetical protein